jgi:hypothetical protein
MAAGLSGLLAKARAGEAGVINALCSSFDVKRR